jgi:rare lipoprotein A
MRLPVEKLLPLAALTLLSACGGANARPQAYAQPAANGPEADYPVVVGDPFVIDGVTYTPADRMNYDAVGYAGVGSDGGASVTAAHRTLPLPSYIEVTALDTGKTILVRVERRGPMLGSNLVELSPGAAAQLGVVGRANAPVRVRRMNPVEQDRSALRMGQPASARMDTPKSLLVVLQRKLDGQEGIVRPAPGTETPPAPAVAALPPKVLPKPKSKAKPATVVTKVPSLPTVAKTPPVAKAPAVVKTPPAVKAPAVAANGKFFVQVGAFSSKANADSSAKKVGGSANATGKLWRVRSGPFASEADAKAALAKVKSAGYSDARIQRAD